MVARLEIFHHRVVHAFVDFFLLCFTAGVTGVVTFDVLAFLGAGGASSSSSLSSSSSSSSPCCTVPLTSSSSESSSLPESSDESELGDVVATGGGGGGLAGVASDFAATFGVRVRGVAFFACEWV